MSSSRARRIAVLGVHLAQRAEPLRLAAIHVMTSLTGSALLALAVDFGELDGEAAWAAGHVDEDWQVEHWGQDAEAVARRVGPQARHDGGGRSSRRAQGLTIVSRLFSHCTLVPKS